ncbi:MAG: aminotransferase class I/II-fold pyridoxal phosphate-dependent enzyme [Sarcina sp.]
MKEELIQELPIIKVINDYMKEDIVPFSMPGHKYSRAFYDDEIANIILKGDITEFDGVDNLHKPEGVIKESLSKLSKLYKSEQSYFLVNGSTSGNMIMIFSAFNEGEKIIVERNCHRSIMNAIILRKLNPIFVNNIIDEKLKAPIGINYDELKEILSKYDDVKGIVLTYPYYYGIGVGVEKIVNLCKEKNLYVLVDSAHGAHFGFNDKLPKSIQDMDVDISVMSAHKTLPSFTQTAYLNVNNKKLIQNVEFYKGVFLSTSPSYMFMMSLEYSRYFLDKRAKNEYDKLFSRIKTFKENIKDLEYVKLVDRDFFDLDESELELDLSRIVLNLNSGLSGHKLLEYLRTKQIQSEMSDEKNVILIPSPFNINEDFERLTKALLDCDIEILKEEEKDFYLSVLPTRVMIPSEVFNKEKIYVNIDNAVGRVAGDNIIPYPPGVPLLIMGELIEEKHIELLNRHLHNDVTVIGIERDKILVVKDV